MSDLPELIPADEVDGDFLLTADFAEVVNGKLYLMGGGWSQSMPSQFPAQMQMGVAAGFRVPFLESNRPHHIMLELRNGDGQSLMKIEGDLETGRPPGARGESILVPLAINGNIQVTAPTALELVASVDGHSRRVGLRVGQAG